MKMNPWIEKIILMLIGQVLTPEVIEEAKVQAIAFLRELAKKTDNKLDDTMVDVLAEALGVKK